MKIAHISDLHLSIKYKPWSYAALKKILKHLDNINIDHLVITGDLTDNAEEDDFVTLRNMLKSFNLLDASRTSIIIGNHDIFGVPQTAQDILSFPSKCSGINYAKAVQKFAHHFFELFEGAFFPLEGEDKNCVKMSLADILPSGIIVAPQTLPLQFTLPQIDYLEEQAALETLAG